MGKLSLEKVARTPKSPWMPFPLLFAAISNEVPAEKMNLVTSNFELFKVCIVAESFLSLILRLDC